MELRIDDFVGINVWFILVNNNNSSRKLTSLNFSKVAHFTKIMNGTRYKAYSVVTLEVNFEMYFYVASI